MRCALRRGDAHPGSKDLSEKVEDSAGPSSEGVFAEDTNNPAWGSVKRIAAALDDAQAVGRPPPLLSEKRAAVSC